jgi:thioredoxin reductase (NADPH)
MARRALEHPKIEVLWNSSVTEIGGNGTVDGVVLQDSITGKTREMAVDGVFVAIGHQPNTSILEGQLDLNELGYVVLAGDGTTATRISGVFAAGDVADARYRQAVSAAGSGCMAAIDAGHYLASLE